MARPRAGAPSSGRGTPPQTYENTMSGYGPTRGDSVGYNPRNPYAYGATKTAKAYNASDNDAPNILKKITST